MAAVFWAKPHFTAVGGPTVYLAVLTVEARAKALTNLRGGIVMTGPKTEFVERVCRKGWTFEDGSAKVARPGSARTVTLASGSS